jgi:hypothetical protein
MSGNTTSPGRLAIQLAIYFVVVVGVMIALTQLRPDVLRYLPLGGTDALSGIDVSELSESWSEDSAGERPARRTVDLEKVAGRTVGNVALFVVGHLTGTIILMWPITWTYRAMNYEAGFNKTFIRSLIVLPICATTIVLLIQDSLALAFGLAALVAAVRFRINLDDAIDGIFIFAAICVGLAAGIGFLGIAFVMTLFFCFGNLILWMVDYGKNPLDDAKRDKKRKKLEVTAPDSVHPAP